MNGKQTKSDLKIEYIYEQVLKEREKYEGKLPSHLDKLFDIDVLKEEKCPCYRMRPKNNFNGVYIVYIYGGFTCRNISEEQWDFISELSIDTGCGLFVPMYPLAPENSCKDTLRMLKKAYSNFCIGMDVDKVILMGDSHGAGLALSLTLFAWKEGYRKPDKLILLSPMMDTEFFDKELEKMVMERAPYDKRYSFGPGVADFINTYWVKDYAVKTEYTSPYYEDCLDLCDNICVFSGAEDMFNCYAASFYQKAKNVGVNIRFFEFPYEYHNFIIHSNSQESKRAYGFLKDVISDTYDESMADIFSLKLLNDWTKQYPEVIKDEWAAKFMYDNKPKFSNRLNMIGKKNNVRLAATTFACDSIIRKYILQFPNCTVINIGCRLENTFSRMDNGRIQWYNIDSHNMMSVRRSIYGEASREKTIGRTIMNLTWLDEITCDRSKGVLIICKELFPYMRQHQVRKLLEALLDKFPGAELVCTAVTEEARCTHNTKFKKNLLVQKKMLMSVNDAEEFFNGWRSDLQVISEEPIVKYFPPVKKLRFRDKSFIRYNKITYNYKVIRMKLGAEVYLMSDGTKIV